MAGPASTTAAIDFLVRRDDLRLSQCAAAPQLNLMSFGFPAGLLAGFWVLWMSMPWMVSAMQAHIEQSLVFLLR